MGILHSVMKTRSRRHGVKRSKALGWGPGWATLASAPALEDGQQADASTRWASRQRS